MLCLLTLAARQDLLPKISLPGCNLEQQQEWTPWQGQSALLTAHPKRVDVPVELCTPDICRSRHSDVAARTEITRPKFPPFLLGSHWRCRNNRDNMFTKHWIRLCKTKKIKMAHWKWSFASWFNRLFLFLPSSRTWGIWHRTVSLTLENSCTFTDNITWQVLHQFPNPFTLFLCTVLRRNKIKQDYFLRLNTA